MWQVLFIHYPNISLLHFIERKLRLPDKDTQFPRNHAASSNPNPGQTPCPTSLLGVGESWRQNTKVSIDFLPATI